MKLKNIPKHLFNLATRKSKLTVVPINQEKVDNITNANVINSSNFLKVVDTSILSKIKCKKQTKSYRN